MLLLHNSKISHDRLFWTSERFVTHIWGVSMMINQLWNASLNPIKCVTSVWGKTWRHFYLSGFRRQRFELTLQPHFFLQHLQHFIVAHHWTFQGNTANRNTHYLHRSKPSQQSQKYWSFFSPHLVPAGETVPSAPRLRGPFSLLLQLQHVLLFPRCLQHLLQRWEMAHCLWGNLPALHCVGPLLSFHSCCKPAISPPRRHTAVGRAVAVIAVVSDPHSWFTAIQFWDTVSTLEQSAWLSRLTSAALWHHTDFSGHWADGSLEGAHCVIRGPSSPSSNATILLWRLVISQGVNLVWAGWPGLFLLSSRDSQTTQFGTTWHTGPQKGILLGHGNSVRPWQSLGMHHELWVQGAERPVLGGRTVRLETEKLTKSCKVNKYLSQPEGLFFKDLKAILRCSNVTGSPSPYVSAPYTV